MIIDFSQATKSAAMILDFRPRVYFKKTHSYLWIRDGRNYGYFLTLEGGSIELTKVKRNEEGVYYVRELISKDKDAIWELRPDVGYDFMKALSVYHNSTLGKSPAAAREIELLLTGKTQDEPEKSEGKPAKRREPSVPVGDRYTLAHICQELNIEPSEARKRLRTSNIEKPGGKWSWPNRDAASAVLKALSK